MRWSLIFRAACAAGLLAWSASVGAAEQSAPLKRVAADGYTLNWQSLSFSQNVSFSGSSSRSLSLQGQLSMPREFNAVAYIAEIEQVLDADGKDLTEEETFNRWAGEGRAHRQPSVEEISASGKEPKESIRATMPTVPADPGKIKTIKGKLYLLMATKSKTVSVPIKENKTGLTEIAPGIKFAIDAVEHQGSRMVINYRYETEGRGLTNQAKTPFVGSIRLYDEKDIPITPGSFNHQQGRASKGTGKLEYYIHNHGGFGGNQPLPGPPAKLKLVVAQETAEAVIPFQIDDPPLTAAAVKAHRTKLVEKASEKEDAKRKALLERFRARKEAAAEAEEK